LAVLDSNIQSRFAMIIDAMRKTSKFEVFIYARMPGFIALCGYGLK
jgi:hypothetical protein